jgi:hypothetical protein
VITYLFVFAVNLAIILPTLLVLVLGQWLLSRYPQPDGNNYLVKFGLSAAVLLAIPYALIASQFQEGNIGIFNLLVLPALDGLLALLLINWRLVYEFWMVERFPASLLLLALLTAVLFTAYRNPWLALLLIVPPLLTALIWILGSRLRAGWLAFLAVILVAVLSLDALGIAGSHAIYSQDWLRNAYKVTSGLFALLALVLAAVFVYQSYSPATRIHTDNSQDSSSEDRANNGSHRWLYLTLAALLLLSVAAVTFRHGMLTHATGRAYEDHLPFGVLAAGLISGLMLAFALPDSARRAGVAYLLLTTVFLMVSYSLGWRVDFESVTTARADRLNRAISDYHQDTGQYPAMLKDLTPGYITVIFGPLTGRGQSWCYQSGPDYYRLGYVYFQRYYDYPDDTPFWEPYYEIKLPYSTGKLPAGEWICDQELNQYKDHGGL